MSLRARILHIARRYAIQRWNSFLKKKQFTKKNHKNPRVDSREAINIVFTVVKFSDFLSLSDALVSR